MNPLGLLAALSVLNITPGLSSGKPLENGSQTDSTDTPKDPEVDQDLSAFLANMKEDFLKSLNLSGVPAHERVKVEPPQFMIDLYNRYTLDKSSIPTSNIVRSFNMEDSSPVDSTDNYITRNILLFNVSVPRHEEVTRAELRLHVSSRQDADGLPDWAGHLAIYDVLEEDLLESNKDPKSCLAFQEVHGPGWEMFEVTHAVKRWVRTDKLKNRLEVELETYKDPAQVSHGSLMLHLSTDSSNVPILVVFSDDRSNGVKESKLELSEMIVHEQETSIINNATNSTRDAEDDDDNKFSVADAHPSLSRRKRSTSNNYCTKTPLRVRFKDIGWNSWIIAPMEYDAFECKGTCYFPLTDDVTPTKHAIVQALMHLKNPEKVAKPCCVPTKLDSITVLYKDDAGVATLKRKYEGMKVAECGCR